MRETTFGARDETMPRATQGNQGRERQCWIYYGGSFAWTALRREFQTPSALGSVVQCSQMRLLLIAVLAVLAGCVHRRPIVFLDPVSQQPCAIERRIVCEQDADGSFRRCAVATVAICPNYVQPETVLATSTTTPRK